jgi:hypothetical protein
VIGRRLFFKFLYRLISRKSPIPHHSREKCRNRTSATYHNLFGIAKKPPWVDAKSVTIYSRKDGVRLWFFAFNCHFLRFSPVGRSSNW